MLKDRGIIIILINKSPISEKKRKTALYKALTGSTDFEKWLSTMNLHMMTRVLYSRKI